MEKVLTSTFPCVQPLSRCNPLHMAKTALRILPALGEELPHETWGDRFALCRKRAGYSGKTISELLKAIGIQGASTATISRLEDADEAPSLSTQRIVATAAMVLYKRSPGLLGLNIDELPVTIYGELVALLTSGPDGGGDLRVAKVRCTAQASGELATVTALRFTQPSFDDVEKAA